jgi:transposase-like protein
MPRPYRLYTEAERVAILAAALAEGLSATEVLRRYGVKPVTYYSWRKKSGLKSTRGRRTRSVVNLEAVEQAAGR